eukprot:3830807-Rhodomonas_salina.3
MSVLWWTRCGDSVVERRRRAREPRGSERTEVRGEKTASEREGQEEGARKGGEGRRRRRTHRRHGEFDGGVWGEGSAGAPDGGSRQQVSAGHSTGHSRDAASTSRHMRAH